MTAVLSDRFKKFVWKFIYGLLILLFVFRVVDIFISNPVIFDNTGYTLDASWIYALNHLDQMGSVSGKNLFFTYGPLGYLLYPLGKNLIPSIIFAGVLSAFDFYALFKLINKQENSVINALLLGSLSLFVETESSFVIFSLLLMCVTAFRFKKGAFSFGLLCLTTALLTLVKFDLAVVSGLFIAAFLVLALIDKSFRERNTYKHFVIMTALTPVLCAVFYLIYNPSFKDLFKYYKSMLLLSSGYSGAMTRAFPINKTIYIIAAFLIVGVAYVVIILFRKRIFYSGVFCLIPLLYAYKSVVVRADGEHFIVSFGIAGMALMLLCFLHLLDTKNASKEYPLYQVFVICFAPCSIAYRYLSSNPSFELKLMSYDLIGICLFAFVFLAVRKFGLFKKMKKVQTISTYLVPVLFMCVSGMLISNHSGGLFSNRVVVYTRLPEQIRSCIGDNTVTAYPWDILWDAEEDLNYVNYPSLQAYVAFDEYIDHMNGEFFASSEAPEFIICEAKAIDYRFFPWEAPETYGAIMENYEYSGLSHQYEDREIFLLRHTDNNDVFEPVTSDSYSSGIQDLIDLPYNGNMRTIRLELHQPPIVKLYSLFYRVRPLYVDITFSDGSDTNFVIIPGSYGRDLPLDAVLPDGSEVNITAIRFWGPTAELYDQNLTYTVTEYEATND